MALVAVLAVAGGAALVTLVRGPLVGLVAGLLLVGLAALGLGLLPQ